MLTAEPLDLDYKHEIIRRVHQERDQAAAVRAETRVLLPRRNVQPLSVKLLVERPVHGRRTRARSHRYQRGNRK